MFKILLIDDDRIIVDGLENMIFSQYQDDCQIVKAYDGSQAISFLMEDYFHLIISDIKMPYLDGLHLLKLLFTHNIPSRVVILSGFDDYTYMRKAMKSGAYDYFLKPVNRKLFLKLMKDLHGNYIESTQTLPKNCIDLLHEESPSEIYFDQPALHPLTEAQLVAELNCLKNLVLQCRRELAESKVLYIFQGLSPSQITENRWKRLMSDFLYQMMEQNGNILRIVARCKLSENDLSAQIKNQPTSGQLMTRFLQILSLYMDELESKKRANDDYIVRNAQDYICLHYSEDLELSDIAGQFHLHPNYFSSVFRKKAGVTFRDFVLQVRMDHAKRLMEDPNIRLVDIAVAVGYEDPAHFNRAFKKLNGMSPSQYRKQK